MAIQTSPCGWEPNLVTCKAGACCPDLEDPANSGVRDLAIQTAIEILWALVGKQFGCCELTVRPCKPKTCDPLTMTDVIYWDSPRLGIGGQNLGVLSFTPTLIGGQVYNISCGCPTGCCTCEADCEVRLPGPVCEIIEVVLDGVVLDPATDYYLLDDTLVFQGDKCPPCQNYNLRAGAVGTWSVKYSIGTPVPASLNLAAGIFACEIGKDLLGQACALPDRVSNVVRPGVQIAFFDPIAFANEGLTGIPAVDRVIRALNPYRLSEEATVWSPDLPRVRREF